MADDMRPKLIHALAKNLVDSRTNKAFLSEPYVEATDLIYVQSVIFEISGSLGSRFSDKPILFFRVLSTREGLETGAFEAAEQMFNRSVSPYAAEALGSLDLVFRSNSSNLSFEGDMIEYLKEFGKERLPIDQCKGSVAAWGIKGGYTGIKHPEVVKKLLHWTYDSWRERGLPTEIAGSIEDALGENPISLDTFERNATEIFDEFCIEFYPEEAKELGII